MSGLVITINTNAAGVASATLTNAGTVYSTTSQTLNAAGQVISSTDAAGVITTYQYDALGRQTGMTVAAGTAEAATSSTSYDALGRKVSQTDANGLTTNYIYDQAGGLIQTTYADGTSTSATYDNVGNKLTSTDQMNQTTTYTYSVSGQILTVTEPAVTNPASGTLVNPVTTYTYDQFGDQISTTTPNGNVAGGNPSAYTTTYQYDSFGNQISKALPMGQASSTTYDSFGRTLTTTDANGQVTLYVYGNSSLVPAAFSANPGSADQLYGKYYFANATNEQAFVADPTGSVQPNETILYSYYTAADVQNGVAGAYVGAEKSVTDNLITPANGDPRSAYTNTTTFQYDSNGNLIQESGPSGTINYMYDLATQRHTETWTGTDYADAETDIAYGYNLLGELASVTVLKEQGASSQETGVSSTMYNADGVGTATTLPNTVYSYDAGGRLTSSFDSATGITTSYAYKPNTSYIQSVTSATAASSVVSSDSYTYRADGLKTGATEYSLNANGTSDTVTLAWNYDALDRLISETSSDTAGTAALNYTDNYSYDLNSNRTTETIENGSGAVTDTITSAYPGAAAHPRPGASAGFRGVEHYLPPACRAAPLNANNELTQTVDANNGTTTYTYDANGSQTGVTSPTGTTTNVYDLQGRLASVVNKNTSGTVTSSATYFYDDQGNPDPRISPAEIGTGLLEEISVTGTNAPVTTYFLVDTQTATGYSQVIEQSTTAGMPAATYIWGETLISQNDAPGTTNAGTYYLIADAHGSTQLLLNSTGGVVQAYNYDSSGNALGFSPSNAITQNLFNQQFFDIISGQYYMRARNYDPATGTFTQQDSINLQPGDTANANFYLYAGADPVNMFDPSGHDLMETLGSLAIQSMLGSIISPVIAPFASAAASLLIPPSLLAALETVGSPDAVELGVDASVGGQLDGTAGGFLTGGLSLLASTRTGNAALYFSGGGGLSFLGGGSGLHGGVGASLGLVWNTPYSTDFETSKLQISLPFSALPQSFRDKVTTDLAESVASSHFLTEMQANEYMAAGWSSTKVDDYQWQVMKDALARTSWLTDRLDSLEVSVFWSASSPGQDIGVSFGMDIFGAATQGVSGGVSVAYTRAVQIAPSYSVILG